MDTVGNPVRVSCTHGAEFPGPVPCLGTWGALPTPEASIFLAVGAEASCSADRG